jgi:hypothetical protein
MAMQTSFEAGLMLGDAIAAVLIDGDYVTKSASQTSSDLADEITASFFKTEE